MRVCDECGGEMTTADGCNEKPYGFPDGVQLERIPHQGEGKCQDCFVLPGKNHHPGCDQEKCPRCGGQVISCSCFDAEDDE